MTEIELVEDPVHLTAAQRYRVHAVCDPLRLLLELTEALVTEERKHATSGASATRYVLL